MGHCINAILLKGAYDPEIAKRMICSELIWALT